MPNPNPKHKFAEGHTFNVKAPGDHFVQLSAMIKPEHNALIARQPGSTRSEKLRNLLDKFGELTHES